MFKQNAQTITNKIIDLRKDFQNNFIDGNVQTFESIMGDSANNLSDAQIARLREKWAIENYKATEFIKLQREIHGLIAFAQKDNKDWFTRFFKKVTKLH